MKNYCFWSCLFKIIASFSKISDFFFKNPINSNMIDSILKNNAKISQSAAVSGPTVILNLFQASVFCEPSLTSGSKASAKIALIQGVYLPLVIGISKKPGHFKLDYIAWLMVGWRRLNRFDLCFFKSAWGRLDLRIFLN